MIPCSKCGGSGWIELTEGLSACPCKKPRARRELSNKELAQVVLAATEASNGLSAIPDYPYDKYARKMICDALVQMCGSPEEVTYIVRRAVSLFRSWKGCGVPGLRQVLCSRFPPRDAKDSGPECISDDYPEGIPSEKDGLTGFQQLEAARPKELPAGSPMTKDSKLAASITALAEKKKLSYTERAEEQKRNADTIRKLEQMGL